MLHRRPSRRISYEYSSLLARCQSGGTNEGTEMGQTNIFFLWNIDVDGGLTVKFNYATEALVDIWYFMCTRALRRARFKRIWKPREIYALAFVLSHYMDLINNKRQTLQNVLQNIFFLILFS